MSDPDRQSETVIEEITHYYLRGKEATRLTVGIGLLEHARTTELISRYLPEQPQVIIDIGGGTGVYACWLARLGHAAHLIDAIQLHVEQARQASAAQPDAPLASCQIGDARQLDLPANLANVALLFGPLYHLLEQRDRIKALQECWRVLKPGGLLMAVGISRFASLHVGLARWWLGDVDFRSMVEKELVDGRHCPPETWPTLFTTAYFHHPDELKSEVTDAGFKHLATLAVEGAGWLVPELEGRWQDPAQRETILAAVRWTEQEPTVLGLSPHIMVVARKSV